MTIIKSITLAYDLIWEKSKDHFGLYKNVKFRIIKRHCKDCKMLTVNDDDTQLYINYCSKCGKDDIDTTNLVQTWSFKKK